MKLGFFYDCRILRDKTTGANYNNIFSSEVWKRYTSVFDSVNVISRIGYIDHQDDIEKRRKKADLENVCFCPISEYTDNMSLLLHWKRIYKSIKQSIDQVDRVIIRLPSMIGLIAASVAKKSGRPYSVEIVGNAFETLWYHGGFFQKVIAGAYHRKVKKAVNKAAACAYLTEDYLEKVYPTSGMQFPNVANVLIDPVRENVLQTRLEHILSNKSSFKIGLVGSLDVRFKGQDVAIEALQWLNEKGYNCELQLVGDGNSDRWKKMIHRVGQDNKVFFVGSLSKQGMIEWMDSIDLYIQPGLTEAHGRSVIEAMSRGCPVITSDVGGMRETNEAEYRVPKNKPTRLAELIEKVIKDKEKQVQMAKRNFYFAKKYEIDKVEKARQGFLVYTEQTK